MIPAQRRDTLITAGGQLLQQALTIITGVLIARSLQSSGYGAVNVLRTIYSMAIILAPFGLDLALLKRGGRVAHPSLLFELVLKRLRWIVAASNIAIAVFVGFGFGGYLAHNVYGNVGGFQPMLITTLVAVPIAADLAILGAYYRSRQQPGIFSLATLYLQPVARLVLVLAMIFSRPSPLAAVAITSIQVALSAIALGVHLHFWRRNEADPKSPAPSPELSAEAWKEVRETFKESSWMALNMFAYGLLRLVDVLVLGAYVSSKIVGEYAAISTVAQLIQVWPLAASQTLGPTISRLYHEGDLEGMKAKLSEYLAMASVVGGFIFGGVAVFGDRLAYIFGNSFHFRSDIALLMATGYLLSATLAPMGYALSMTGRHKGELSILGLGGISLFALCRLLIPHYGQIGAASAVAVCFAVINITRFVYVAKVLRFVPGRLNDFLPPLICLGLGYLTKWGFESILGQNLIATICGCIAYGGAYVLCALTFLVDPAVKAGILQRLRRR